MKTYTMGTSFKGMLVASVMLGIVGTSFLGGQAAARGAGLLGVSGTDNSTVAKPRVSSETAGGGNPMKSTKNSTVTSRMNKRGGSQVTGTLGAPCTAKDQINGKC